MTTVTINKGVRAATIIERGSVIQHKNGKVGVVYVDGASTYGVIIMDELLYVNQQKFGSWNRNDITPFIGEIIIKSE